MVVAGKYGGCAFSPPLLEDCQSLLFEWPNWTTDTAHDRRADFRYPAVFVMRNVDSSTTPEA